MLNKLLNIQGSTESELAKLKTRATAQQPQGPLILPGIVHGLKCLHFLNMCA